MEAKGIRIEAGSSGSVAKIVRPVAGCPVTNVTVFSDRAEVTRVCEVELSEVGQYEVMMEGLPESANLDSLRVKGVGHCMILEVSNEVHFKVVPEAGAVPEEAKASDDVDALRSRERSLQDELATINDEISQIEKSKALFDSYAANVLNPVITPKTASGGDGSVSVPDLDFVSTLLDAHTSKNKAAANALRALKARASTANDAISTVRAQLAAKGATVRTVTQASRDATVVIAGTAPGKVSLQFIYMVSGASWKPSYDIRISSAESSLELTYYGLITQSSGEDWNEALLTLSTATPSVGGVAPKLPSKHVKFGSAALPMYISAPMASSMNMQAAMFDAAPPPPSASSRSRSSAPAPMPRAAVQTATVTTGTSSAAFAISRPATIASDNKPHKVTIAILPLASRFRHYSAPSLEPAAYLQALTTNDSEFTLLASDKVNVFLDNNFVATTSFENRSPHEAFRNFLGVDNAVKVEYKDKGVTASTSGFLSKTATSTYKFVTTVKNTKATPIVITVADIFPRASDSRIKIKLISPEQEELDAGTKAEDSRAAGRDTDEDSSMVGGSNTVAQNAITNNIVWNRTIPPQGKTTITLEYIVEYPMGEDIVIA